MYTLFFSFCSIILFFIIIWLIKNSSSIKAELLKSNIEISKLHEEKEMEYIRHKELKNRWEKSHMPRVIKYTIAPSVSTKQACADNRLIITNYNIGFSQAPHVRIFHYFDLVNDESIHTPVGVNSIDCDFVFSDSSDLSCIVTEKFNRSFYDEDRDSGRYVASRYEIHIPDGLELSGHFNER
ncbi:MAG: hypothetical protein WCH58_02190 [Candidatus Saccharibacteria bacterium]